MKRRHSDRRPPVWSGKLPVHEHTFANGMKVLLLRKEDTPLVICDLHYPAGAADEPPGLSGIAHFVEHMLFKGTSLLPKGHIDYLTYLAAGHGNAETGDDHTHYWFAFPRERWELALEIEADRMHNAVFDPEEVEAERQVIAEEHARELDTPQGRLELAYQSVAFNEHPYQNPILGRPEHLSRITCSELAGFYREHYRPDGAVLVAIGDLGGEAALERVAAYFEALPAGQARGARAEPAAIVPRGRRSFEIADSDCLLRGLMGWHTVPRFGPEVPALGVLSDVLACGRQSRLWRRLVEEDRLAIWVDASHEAGRLAGQLQIQVEAVPGVTPAQLEEVIIEELDRLAEQGPSREELARSRARLDASWRWDQQDLPGLAASLGVAALWSHWEECLAQHQAALAVTAQDIEGVARRYLIDDRFTAGWSLPDAARALSLGTGGTREARSREGPSESTCTEPIAVPAAFLAPVVFSPLKDYKPERHVFGNGLRLITEHREDTGTIALELYVESGMLRESKPGVAFLAGRLREEGTCSRSAEELALAIEDAGGSLDVTATGVSARFRSEDLPLALDLIADLTLRPAFPAEALPWIRKRTASELKSDGEDPAFLAEQAFRRLVYGGHPLARDPRGTASAVRRITIGDIQGHHQRLTRPDRAFLIAAGDFDPKRLKQLAGKQLAKWPGGTEPLPPVAAVEKVRRPVVRVIEHASEQVQIVLGHLGITRSDPDYPALAVLDLILGSGPGFTDHLSRILREEHGLAYSVSGAITDSADILPGALRVYIATSPSEAQRAWDLAVRVIKDLHEGRFSDEEIRLAQDYTAVSWMHDYQTVPQRAERLFELARWDLPLDDPLSWPDRIQQLKPEDIRRAARRHIQPEALVEVLVGPLKPRS